MTQVLYRKYRPKTFAEIVGQEHVVRTLKGALLNNRVGHAYLFSGPRGIGKTTMARLLAKALNCSLRNNQLSTVNYQPDQKKLGVGSKGLAVASAEPCNLCFSCQEINEGRSLDIIEIDGASNRGIDEIRNVKESARVAAASGSYKVFIIDEVHMLTPPAFSALLKTLEEPPAHVVFILATTDPHKIALTILSRVQRLEFKKLTSEQIVDRLTKLSKLEKIHIDVKALNAIAHSAEGALRDAESSLTKLISFAGDHITVEHIKQVLGIVPSEIHHLFLNALANSDVRSSLEIVESLYQSGVSLEIFLKQFVSYLRLALLFKVSPQVAREISKLSPADEQNIVQLISKVENERLIKIMSTLVGLKNEMKSSPIPQLPLELAIIELTK